MFRFGNHGLRNGSLIFNGFKAHNSNQFQPLSVANQSNIGELLNKYVYDKTSAFATIFLNISVTDINHLLEPTENGIIFLI